MVATLDKIRTNLRAELMNTLPDYSSIASAIENAAKEKLEADKDNALAEVRRIGLREANMKAQFTAFKLAVEKCPAA